MVDIRLGSSLTRTLFTDDDFDIDVDDVADDDIETIEDDRLRPFFSKPSGEPVADRHQSPKP